jgi:hypothetical protein
MFRFPAVLFWGYYYYEISFWWTVEFCFGIFDLDRNFFFSNSINLLILFLFCYLSQLTQTKFIATKNYIKTGSTKVIKVFLNFIY